MAQYTYRAVDTVDVSVTGTVEGASAYQAVQTLRERGLTVTAIEEIPPRRSILSPAKGLKWEELQQFCGQLQTVTEAKLPVGPALKALALDVHKPRLRNVMRDIHERMEAGNTLETALSHHPDSFSPMFLTLIRAGERAGNLSAVFDALNGYSKRMVELKNNVQEALAYPLFLITSSALVMLWMLLKILPSYAEAFTGFGVRLPLLTEALLVVSTAIREFPLLCTGAAAVVVLSVAALVLLFLRDGASGLRSDWVKLHFPVLGGVYEAASLGRFSRALSILLKAEVPLPEGVELAAAASGNAVLGRAATNAVSALSAGGTLGGALRQTGYFDNSYCWLLEHAEQRGELGETLSILEDDCQRTVDHRRRFLMLMVGPAVVVLIGVLMGTLLVAMYLPIFSLGDSISVW
ncbi:MAG: hypothetical protein GWP08_14565 [Nitrospiraceae bacterium]|nr:hypothetical protein [Nitrospiraceae bacterium]